MLRTIVKLLLSPIKKTVFYEEIQAWSMSRDILSGRFSEPELELLEYAVKKNEIVIDVGANFGMYTYPLSKIVGDSGRVFAYEPIPFTFRTLTKIIRKLSIRSVSLSNKAVSDKRGKVTFAVPLQTSGQLMAGQAHFVNRNDDHPGKETQVRWKHLTSLTCETITLDEDIDASLDVSFIKIDIEGAEYFAFKGATRIIKNSTPSILIEINPWFLDGFEITLDDLVGPFYKLGYELFRYQSQKLRKMTASEEIVEDNYLLIHPKYLERFTDLL
ncbi:MAG: hypothetical protein CMK56_01855 [Proteobacteria bacterium]|nr:hypothetical protein [Pseudomonadota bacterium]|tara:strand:- start:15 stop:830 length:816 start_codon:yes stop_codon:yes gene_type:complete